MNGRGITLLDWKAILRNTLCGFACVKIERVNLRVDDVAIHQEGAARWASLPSKPMLVSAGSVLRDASTGKVRYQPLLQWGDRKTADRFSARVVELIEQQYPGALGGGEQ